MISSKLMRYNRILVSLEQILVSLADLLVNGAILIEFKQQTHDK